MLINTEGKAVWRAEYDEWGDLMMEDNPEKLSGVMGDGKIFLSNLDSSALFCVMSAFPDGKRIEKYKINIVDEGQVLNIAIYESPQLDDSDFMGGRGCVIHI